MNQNGSLMTRAGVSSMRNKITIKLFAMLTGIAFTFPATGNIYKYVDKNGKVTYSDSAFPVSGSKSSNQPVQIKKLEVKDANATEDNKAAAAPVPSSAKSDSAQAQLLSEGSAAQNGMPDESVKNIPGNSVSNGQAKRQNAGVKWNPGHYLLIYPQGKSSDIDHARYMKEVMQELVNNPGLRGIQKIYFWNKLEPVKGKYDFSEIRKDLDALAKINKRLVISFQERSFQHGEVFAPSYLRSSEYEGGIYKRDNANGYNVAYWNKNVQNRIIEIIREMGRQFDGHPNLEAINFEETAHGKKHHWAVKYSDRYFEGVLRVAGEARAAFPTTVVIQYVNYGDWNLPKIFSTLKGAGVGVGGPDVSENDRNLAKASYAYFPKLSGTLPVGMAVQYHNYDSNTGGKSATRPSIASIHNFAQNKLKANYIFWLMRGKESWNDTNYYQDVVNHLNTIDWQADPHGGLDSRCPAAFASCKTN